MLLRAIITVIVVTAVMMLLSLAVMGSVWPGVVIGITGGTVGCLAAWGTR